MWKKEKKKKNRSLKKKKNLHVCNSLTLIYYTLSIVIVYIVVTKNKLWRTNASVFFVKPNKSISKMFFAVAFSKFLFSSTC